MGDILRTSALLISLGLNIASGTTIAIGPGAGLAGNAEALAAFNRAANSWSQWLTDPISVRIDADLVDTGNDSVIASTGALFLQAPFDTVRNQMVFDALIDEASDDAILAAMPAAASYSTFINAGFLLTANIAATKANLKAMGFAGLDAAFGATDAVIQINSGFAFDYNRSNGIAPGTIDFESVALHEIGHALGFISAVDDLDFLIANALNVPLTLYPIDLFRFSAAAVVSTATFGQTRAFIAGQGAVFSDGVASFPMSTGAFSGDGRQASHWKDNVLTGTRIGAMDPTLASQEIWHLSYADLRALDVVGWDFDSAAFVPVPETATFACAGMGIASILWYRRRRLLS